MTSATTSRNVILTGVPRSGTTVTSHLLNRLPNMVALHEPWDVRRLATLGTYMLLGHRITRLFAKTRRSIWVNRTAVSKHVGGEVPTDSFGYEREETGLRPSLDSKGEIRIDKALTLDFLLVIKHPSAFTAVLEGLNKRFATYAVIRNPLAILASWNSVKIPVYEGHAPAAERLDRRLRRRLGEIGDRIERQLYLLSWFFEKYRTVLPNESVLKYEHIISSRGRALSAITPHASSLDVPLPNLNRNDTYDRELMKLLGRRLLKTNGPYWAFYTRESVEELLRD